MKYYCWNCQTINEDDNVNCLKEHLTINRMEILDELTFMEQKKAFYLDLVKRLSE